MPSALVIGGSGFIGIALAATLERRGFEVSAPSRKDFDLLNPPKVAPQVDIVYICAAMTKFIDCENNSLSYRINVDGPIKVANLFPVARIVFLSSEAVEKALHTNYGMQKALAELALRPRAVIVRLSKVTNDRVFDCCDYLASLFEKPPGIYHWP